MTIQEMKRRKSELGFTNEDIARKSGIPLSTVNKFFGGSTKNPRRSTILAIESVLAGRQSSRRLPDYLDGLKEQILKTQPGISIGDTIGHLVQYGCGGPVCWEPDNHLADEKKKELYEAKPKPLPVREPEPA